MRSVAPVLALAPLFAGCGRVAFDPLSGDALAGSGSGCVSGAPLVPIAAYNASASPPTSACNINNVLGLDSQLAGLDRLSSDTCNAATWDPSYGSCGCIGIDLGGTYPVGLVEVWAVPVAQACTAPCGAGLCGTGDTMSILTGTTLGEYQPVDHVSLGSTLTKYAVAPQPSSVRYVVVCREGQSSDRDDVAIDQIVATCR